MSIDTLARRAAPLLCALPLMQGCVVPAVDLKRVAYEMLRREDCRLNQLEEFCQRTFANDYAEYEDLRREFIRDRNERASGGGAQGSDRGSGR